MADTLTEYRSARTACRELFERKARDYGTSWRIMRLPSLTDQLYIKARRVRSLETGDARVQEGIEPELIALVNYSLLALVQQTLGDEEAVELAHDRALELYDTAAEEVEELMLDKNHDYGEAWREMRTSSLTDLILMKLHRIKQIENNAGETEVSEGVRGGYADIANYSLFALIKMAGSGGPL